MQVMSESISEFRGSDGYTWIWWIVFRVLKTREAYRGGKMRVRICEDAIGLE